MKGNQESMLYTTNATVAALNHVSGFDPLKFLRRTTSRKTGEDVMRLDLRYKKLWFRLACPTGRLKLNALRITEKMAIFEAKVYRDREDAEPLSSYVANCTLDTTPGGLYVEAAQEEALDTALSNAGFGIQFADVGSESEEYGSEVPVGAKPEISKLVQTKAEVAEPVQKQPEPVKATPQESAKADPLDAIMADDIMEQVKHLPGYEENAYTIAADDEAYQSAAASISSLDALVKSLLIGIIVVSIIILALILTLWGKARVHETGVFLSLGIKKGNILGQYIAEVLLIAVFAFAASGITSNMFAATVADTLLQQTVQSNSCTERLHGVF